MVHPTVVSTLPADEPALLLQLRAYEHELQQRRAELEIISTVQQALANRLDMQEIYELVGEDLRKVFDAQVVIIATFNQPAGGRRGLCSAGRGGYPPLGRQHIGRRS